MVKFESPGGKYDVDPVGATVEEGGTGLAGFDTWVDAGGGVAE